MIIIGSTALEYYNVPFREPQDVDVMATERMDGYDTIVVPQDILDLIPHNNNYATFDAVYTIKCSHLGWDVKWQKHKNDALYLKAIGAKKIENLYEALVEYWKEQNGNKPYLSLYQKKSDFFNDHVDYVYDHDYLHELVAYPDKPMYTYCLKEGQAVAIDKDRFDELSLEQKLRMFREEIGVIAAERWLIPGKVSGKYTWQKAYSLALHKTITALTKNWATDFLIEHLDYFVKPNYSYFEHLLNTLKEGERLMANQVENREAIVTEIIEAYNATEPRWLIDVDSPYERFVDLKDFGEFKHLDQDGGGEGGAEVCYFIFQWKGNIYRLDYNYYSYDGYNFDYATMYEGLEPKQKTVTVYE